MGPTLYSEILLTDINRIPDECATFFVVAREGSFTRATVQLGASQAALSRAIRSLDQSDLRTQICPRLGTRRMVDCAALLASESRSMERRRWVSYPKKD